MKKLKMLNNWKKERKKEEEIQMDGPRSVANLTKEWFFFNCFLNKANVNIDFSDKIVW